MSRKKSQSNSDFVNLFLQAADNESSDKGMAREFLASEGVNVDRMVSDGLKRIKQMQMIAEAKKNGAGNVCIRKNKSPGDPMGR